MRFGNREKNSTKSEAPQLRRPKYKRLGLIFALSISLFFITKYIYYHYFFIDENALRNNKWKCLGGYCVGDFLYVDSVKSDTTTFVDDRHFIYKGNLKVGQVINVNSTHLTIKSPQGKKGYYMYH
jgi:hypothetical protein